MRRLSLHASPGRLFLGTILGVIALGALALSLPWAQTTPVSFLDTLFTATSATCVTGVLTCPLSNFTLFGKIVLLCLIQVGGIGLITLTVFFASIFFNVGIKTHLIAGQLFELESWHNSKRLITFVIGLTLASEAIGALLLYLVTPITPHAAPAWFSALFHSVSAFCSAGLSTFDPHIGNVPNSTGFLIVTGLLMLIGELGFITWHEAWNYLARTLKNERCRISLHSRLVLGVTFAMIAITWTLFLLYEPAQTSWLAHIGTTLYNAISLRSCGYTTFDTALVQPCTLFLIMVIAFIGSSPGSTGSGIKNTSLAVVIANARSVIMGRTHVEIQGRRLPLDQVRKVLSVISIALFWVVTTIFVLLMTESHIAHTRFIDIVFEAIAAFANLGLTRNVTPHLSIYGKIIVMVSMVLGRIGALTLLLSLRKQKSRHELYYPEERIILS